MPNEESVIATQKMVYKLAAHYWNRLPLRLQRAIDIDDLAQDAALEIWRKADRYDSAKAKFTTWAYTVAQRAMLHSAAKLSAECRAGTRTHFSLTPLEDEDGDAIEPLTDVTPESIALLRERLDPVEIEFLLEGVEIA